MWKTDKEGKILDIPDHAFSDAMDAIRYPLESLRPAEDEDEEYTSGNLSKLYLGR